MTARELILRELNLLIDFIPHYRRDFEQKFALMRSVGTEQAFKDFVDAYVTLKSAEDRVDFINDVLEKASE